MPEEALHLLRGAWVAPMDAPVLRDGAVVLRGNRIVAAGAASALLRAHPGADTTDFGDAVLLPGLVNAHTHLELRHGPRPIYFGSFVGWLRAVMSTGATGPVAQVVAEGAAESIHWGVTCVGDISKEPLAARSALAATAIAGVSYGEVVGMAGRRHALEPRLAAAVGVATTGGRVIPGISPHAPYSVDADGYRRCLDAARRNGMPLTTHLAESPDEAAFLADHSGPFRDLWDHIGAWDDSPPRFSGGPIRYAQSLGLLDYPLTLLAHVNYCDDAELEILAADSASVVYCPRTHVYFGHPPHRWRGMLAAGINVAVGTDSRASAPDLNLVDDLRLLRRLAPEVRPEVLWEMATVRGARALGLANEVGTLAAGKRADLVVFPATTDDPLAEVLDGTALPVAVWADGREALKGSNQNAGDAKMSF